MPENLRQEINIHILLVKQKKEGYEQIDAIFQETADNEKELSKFKS